VATLVVTVSETVAAGVRLLRLARTDGLDLPAWEPGAHIDLRLPGDLVRQYSLCGSQDDRASWTVAVLHQPAGRGGSHYLHHEVCVGDEIAVAGPRNLFPLAPAQEYVFLAGGIGITPLLPMIEQVAHTGVSWRLHYGGRGRASMAFLDRLAAHADHVHVHPEDEVGMLDVGTVLASAGSGAEVYACGPSPMLAEVERRCAETGHKLRIERFAATPGLSVEVDSGSFEVELAQSGLTLEVPEGRAITEMLDECGIFVPTSCQEGICGTCETKVLGGEVDHRDSILTEGERVGGDTMMLCVSRSRTPRLVLDL